MQQPSLCPPVRDRGFTLVELMIAVVVAGVLLAVALPSFTGSLRKSRRSDAFSALTAVQQAQERWRSLHGTYAANSDLTVATTATPPGLGLAASTASGNYGIAISDPSANGYTVIATATSTGSQSSDAGCATMAVLVSSGDIKYGGSSGSIDWTATNPDPNRCWNR
jgi:type IV pilus assembly protein PilE